MLKRQSAPKSNRQCGRGAVGSCSNGATLLVNLLFVGMFNAEDKNKTTMSKSAARAYLVCTSFYAGGIVLWFQPIFVLDFALRTCLGTSCGIAIEVINASLFNLTFST